VIDRTIKRCLGQMMKGVQVVTASDGTTTRGYCSHWVCQISFDQPIVMASCSPKHDTHPLIVQTQRFAVSILAADQVEIGQYFSYPGRKFRYMAPEYLSIVDGWAVVPDAIAWLGCEVFDATMGLFDHDLFFARVIAVGDGRLKAPPLLYSSRLGWRATGERAREPGESVRDRLLARLAALGIDEVGDDDGEDSDN
jgi:flavin reductase (DIM6/NTAB) family NADH-FMN oxidoreductase RutF